MSKKYKRSYITFNKKKRLRKKTARSNRKRSMKYKTNKNRKQSRKNSNNRRVQFGGSENKKAISELKKTLSNNSIMDIESLNTLCFAKKTSGPLDACTKNVIGSGAFGEVSQLSKTCSDTSKFYKDGKCIVAYKMPKSGEGESTHYKSECEDLIKEYSMALHLVGDNNSKISKNKFAPVSNYDSEFSHSLNTEHQKLLDDNNIVKYLGLIIPGKLNNISIPPRLYIDIYSDGSLSSFLKKKNISVKTKHIFMSDILKGLTFLHSKNVVHCDLKADNVLVSNTIKSKGKPQYYCKITDFGKSILSGIQARNGNGTNRAEINDNPSLFNKMKDEMGSKIAISINYDYWWTYQDNELPRCPYTHIDDLYLFGVLCVEVLSTNSISQEWMVYRNIENDDMLFLLKTLPTNMSKNKQGSKVYIPKTALELVYMLITQSKAMPFDKGILSKESISEKDKELVGADIDKLYKVYVGYARTIMLCLVLGSCDINIYDKLTEPPENPKTSITEICRTLSLLVSEIKKNDVYNYKKFFPLHFLDSGGKSGSEFYKMCLENLKTTLNSEIKKK